MHMKHPTVCVRGFTTAGATSAASPLSWLINDAHEPWTMCDVIARIHPAFSTGQHPRKRSEAGGRYIDTDPWVEHGRRTRYHIFRTENIHPSDINLCSTTYVSMPAGASSERGHELMQLVAPPAPRQASSSALPKPQLVDGPVALGMGDIVMFMPALVLWYGEPRIENHEYNIPIGGGGGGEGVTLLLMARWY